MLYRYFSMAVLASALAASVACHDKEKYLPLGPDNPDGRDLTKILSIEANPATVPADGVSRTRISAHIDPSATVRTISFETTLGTLSSGAKSVAAQAGSLQVDADSSGIATVELQTTATVATARVTASVRPSDQAAAIVRVIDVPFSAVVADQLFTLSTSASSLPADGFSTATITVTMTFSGDRQQQVMFTASRGSLVAFGAGAGDSGATVQADASGVARIQLRSDGTIGTARVSAKALGFERATFIEFTAINPDTIITVRPDVDTASADGFTRTRIVARVSPLIPDTGTNRTVRFTTTDGTFATDTVPGTGNQVATVKADASNVAIVDLRSPMLPVTAGITATVSNVTARTSITFVKAQPDTVFVQADASSVPSSGAASVNLTAYVLRDVGTPATNSTVTWEARDAGGNLIGAFSSITLATPDPDDTAAVKRLKATATFNPDDTAVLGAATITAKVGGISGRVTIVLN